jgi:prepilin-type N-terminal cleavage/methylation domain-containing protein
MRPKKKPFTLLEVMVCLVILSLITGTCLWKGSQFLSHHRFTSDSQKLSRQIEELHAYALCHGASIDLELFYDKGVLSYVSSSDDPITYISSSNVSIDKLKTARGSLPGITFFKVKDKRLDKATIHFHPKMGITSPESISFHLHKPSSNNDSSYYIDLVRGIPFNLLSKNPDKINPNSLKKPE